MAQLSDIRTAIATAISGATGGGYTLNAARVKKGFVPGLQTSEFLTALLGAGSSSAGPYAVVRSGNMTSAELQLKLPDYTIPVDLYMAIPLNTADDFVNIETFVNAIKLAIKGAGNVQDISYEYNEKDLRNLAMTIHYEFLVFVTGCGTGG